ncbi:hypothetical protein RBB77_08390 [Tunturibacter psychrotolerans]|uniref:CGNR zinc finger domain-containing protein n=1 Tax=Tunturiibacter psychrotolerans TaxID=3069686 RepID=A0AAU7ZVK7_9BACT
MTIKEDLRQPNMLVSFLNREDPVTISNREDMVRFLKSQDSRSFPHHLYIAKPSKASHVRVLYLIKAIQTAAQVLKEERSSNPNRGDRPMSWALKQALWDVDNTLHQYPLRTTIEISETSEQDELYFDRHMDGTRPRPTGEVDAVSEIVSLAETKRLSLLRQCICQRWFFARRLDQKACSVNCRQKAHGQTETFKAKRREYMRDNYALKKSGKVK